MALQSPTPRKGLLADAQKLQKMGNGGDSILAHIGPKEALMLKQAGGAGTINPRTGLLQFEGTGAEGSGEGPGAEGGVGGDGPGGAGSGGPGNGASADGGLTGHESATAVESGSIPGTPVGTPEMNSVGTAATMGLLGHFGQPSIGVLDGPVNGLLGNPIGSIVGAPVSAIPGLGVINGLIGLAHTVGLLDGVPTAAQMAQDHMGLPTAAGMLNGPPAPGSGVSGAVDAAMNGAPTGVNAGAPTGGTGGGGGPGPGGHDGGDGSGAQSGFTAPPLQTPTGPPSPFQPFTLPPQPQFAYSPLLNPTNPLLRFGTRGLLGR